MLFPMLFLLFLLATLTSAFALPNDAAAAAAAGAAATAALSTKHVSLHLFTSPNCGGSPIHMSVAADICYAFAPGIQSLRVIGHDEGIRYNALNVYTAADCESGPVLQPVLSDGCSAVVVYRAIKLSIDTPRV